MPGFPVHHQLPQLAQTHVHRLSDNSDDGYTTLLMYLGVTRLYIFKWIKW